MARLRRLKLSSAKSQLIFAGAKSHLILGQGSNQPRRPRTEGVLVPGRAQGRHQRASVEEIKDSKCNEEISETGLHLFAVHTLCGSLFFFGRADQRRVAKSLSR